MKILPSIASADVLHIAEEISRLGFPRTLHFDVEDGNFTPNLTFGQKMMRAVGGFVHPGRLDVHLMTTEPERFLETAAESGAESICAHLEAMRFPLVFLNKARRLGMKAGLALNIGTPVEVVTPFLASTDFLLVMTAEPDDQGETLSDYALGKAMAAAENLRIPVYADGALNEQALEKLKAAGAAGCVVGRLVFRSEDPAARLRSLCDTFA